MLQATVCVLRLLTILQARRSWSAPTWPRGSRSRTSDAPAGRRSPAQSRVSGASRRRGTAGGYSLEPGALLLPLMLDDDEAVAVAVALHIAAASTVAGDGGRLAAGDGEARARPARAPADADRSRSAFGAHPPGGGRTDRGLWAVSAPAAACSGNRRRRSRVPLRRRRREQAVPASHRIVHMEPRWYLVAWDTAREDRRTFRRSTSLRIALPHRRDGAPRPRAPRPRPAHFARYITRAVSSAPYSPPVRVVLHAPTAADATVDRAERVARSRRRRLVPPASRWEPTRSRRMPCGSPGPTLTSRSTFLLSWVEPGLVLEPWLARARDSGRPAGDAAACLHQPSKEAPRMATDRDDRCYDTPSTTSTGTSVLSTSR